MADMALRLMDEPKLGIRFRACAFGFNALVFAGWYTVFNYHFRNSVYGKEKNWIINPLLQSGKCCRKFLCSIDEMEKDFVCLNLLLANY